MYPKTTKEQWLAGISEKQSYESRQYKRLAIFLFIITFVFALILTSASRAEAAYYVYGCSDLNSTGGGVSCLAGTFSFDGAGTGYAFDNPASHGINMTSATTYYFTANVTGSGEARFGTYGAGTNSDGYTLNASAVDTPFVSGTGPWNGLALTDSGAGAFTTNNGSATGNVIFMDSVCVADTPGECPAPPIPPTPTSTASTTSAIFTRDEGMLIVGVFVFIFSIPFWEKILTVSSRRYEA
jgi:hypothetical protein